MVSPRPRISWWRRCSPRSSVPISFWGSIIAFGKLQEILPGRPIGLGKAQQLVNLALLVVAVGAAVVIGVNAHPGSGGASLWWMIGLLAAAGVLA